MSKFHSEVIMKDRRDHADHTAEEAVGAANKEWRKMARLALQIREGRCDPTWATEQETKFIGIYRRLLSDPVDELKREARR